MRFNTVEEVANAAARAAACDWIMYLSHRSNLNPYCTQGARSRWQRGFIGAAPRTWEHIVWDFQYQRGAAAARIVQENLANDRLNQDYA